MSNNLKTQRGFTILEFLIYISVLSVISLVIGGSFLSLTSGRARNESRIEVSSSIKTVMDRIKDDLKNASYVVYPSVGNNSPVLQLVVNTDLVTYYVDNYGAVIRYMDGNQVPLVPNTVKFTNINFEHIQNVSIPLLKIVTSIGVDLVAEYISIDPARAYSEKRISTFSLGRLFDIMRPSGSSNAPGMDFSPTFPGGNPCPSLIRGFCGDQ